MVTSRCGIRWYTVVYRVVLSCSILLLLSYSPVASRYARALVHARAQYSCNKIHVLRVDARLTTNAGLQLPTRVYRRVTFELCSS